MLEGTKLSAVYLMIGDKGCFQVGADGVIDIHVVYLMHGNGYEPWAKVSYKDGGPIMINFRYVHIVHLPDEK